MVLRWVQITLEQDYQRCRSESGKIIISAGTLYFIKEALYKLAQELNHPPKFIYGDIEDNNLKRMIKKKFDNLYADLKKEVLQPKKTQFSRDRFSLIHKKVESDYL